MSPDLETLQFGPWRFSSQDCLVDKIRLRSVVGHEPDDVYLSIQESDGGYRLGAVYDPKSESGRAFAFRCKREAEAMFETAKARAQ